MTSRDFCYWLQGWIEVETAGQTPMPARGLNPVQVAVIQAHLNMVFAHEIDPSFGDKDHQQKLDAAHAVSGGVYHPPKSISDLQIRC